MNQETLSKWIKENYTDQKIENVSRLYNGVVNNTNLVTFSNKEKVVIKSSNSYDVGSIRKLRWQYEVQSDLGNIFPVPKVFKYCSDRSIIGNPFYIMEYIEGESKYDFNSVKKSFDLLYDLHKLNLVDLVGKKYKKDVSIEQVIEKTYKQYKITETNKSLDVDYIFNWLKNNIPKERVSCFCHNDWRMSNILFSSDGEIRSVIDWELSDIGDPRADLGIAMSYWPEKLENSIDVISPEPPFNFNHVNKNYFVKLYFEKSGFDFLDWKFFEIFGLFRLIRVGQLGRYRHDAGIVDNIMYNDIDKRIKTVFNKCKGLIEESNG